MNTLASLSGGAPVKATLKESDTKKVAFNFNPQKIGISHAHQRQPVNSGTRGGAGASPSGNADGSGKTPLIHQDQVTQVGPTTITLSDLVFDGAGTVDACKMLLGWSYPHVQEGSSTAAELTKLTFTWGNSISYSVTLVSVDISYVRFTSSGQPIRATANLRLQYEGTPPPGTNPTSGGIPGRRSHTLVSGENLQHVAMANYGKPGAWRALAAANGIEDPLAVQPGTIIYLPAPAELADGRPR